MYTAIKKLIKTFLPEKVLFRYEPWIRGLYYQFYRGKTYRCTICEKGLRQFIQTSGDNICPRCGSLSRTRRLWDVLHSGYLRPNISILDFSPSRSIYRYLKRSDYNYVSSDLSGDFLSEVKFDITKMPVSDNHYDLIICYHILEHIEDDQKAMKELCRVLKRKGHCVIQTPFKEGTTYEDFTIKTDSERLQHFGQEDHVRVYSVAGLKERLTNSGFNVKVLEFNEAEDNFHGYKTNEIVLVCEKS